MEVVFFGDSLTAGENCHTTFTEFMPETWNVRNFGVSGTTIGEYSIFPVDGDSLLGQIGKHQDYIKKADVVFIEYGSNDISAIMCGFATVQTVIVSLVKALDWIKQLNPNCQIKFLALSSDEDVIKEKAFNMCTYLQYDYFSNFKFVFPEGVYEKTYFEILDNIDKVCDIIYMFDRDMNYEDKYISSDNIHPNEAGHLRIAKNIISNCYL